MTNVRGFDLAALGYGWLRHQTLSPRRSEMPIADESDNATLLDSDAIAAPKRRDY